LSWPLPKAPPYVMGAGADQVMVGVALVTVKLRVTGVAAA
jgi:hypothetical protein